MKNMETFKALSGLLFAELYSSFPFKTTIHCSELSIKLNEDVCCEGEHSGFDHLNVHDYIRPRKIGGIAKPAIEWLASAGLITFNSYSDGDFHGVCLTAKGLEAIEAEMGRGQSLLEAAEGIAAETTCETAKENLRDIFSCIMKWCVEKSPTVTHISASHATH